MNLFRKEKVIKFDEKEVIIREMTTQTLLKLSSGEYKDNISILADHTNLKWEDLDNLSIKAEEYLLKEFQDINKDLLVTKEDKESEKIDEKK